VLRHQVLGDDGAEVVVGELLDPGDLVRGAEAVEEVEERDAREERRPLGDGGQIVGLLHRAGGEQAEAGLPDRHHVRVIAEDGEAWVATERALTCMHMGVSSPAILYMFGIMRRQALRRREGRRERARASAPWTAPDAPPSDCISLTLGTVPHTFFWPRADHSSPTRPCWTTA